MRANLESTRGLIFSGQFAARPGGARRLSRRRVPSRAGTCHARLERRPGLSPGGAGRRRAHQPSTTKKIEYAFDLSRQLKNVNKIFARVFEAPVSRARKPPESRRRQERRPANIDAPQSHEKRPSTLYPVAASDLRRASCSAGLRDRRCLRRRIPCPSIAFSAWQSF